MVDAYGYLAFQGLPGRFGISRPHPSAPAGDAQVAIAVETPGTGIGEGGERALVIELMAPDPFVEIEPVAFVRPEGVCAGFHQPHMLLPVALDMTSVYDLTSGGGDAP